MGGDTPEASLLFLGLVMGWPKGMRFHLSLPYFPCLGIMILTSDEMYMQNVYSTKLF